MYFIFVLTLIASVSHVFSEVPNVLILSFGGINFSYITQNNTPELFKLISENNVAGPILTKSVFPTKTMVTHFSLSTGQYPDIHGVYNNEMFATDDTVWSNKQEQFLTNENLIPIWIENQKTGNGRNSGMMMWPAGEFEFKGKKAEYIQPFDASIGWNTRVDTIVDWMTNGNKKANLVMAYFEDAPKCNELNKVDTHIQNHMGNIDMTIKKLYTDLQSRLPGNFHMIAMSDYGTQRVQYDHVLFVDKYLSGFNKDDFKIIMSGPLLFVKPTEAKYEEIMSAFNSSDESVSGYVANGIHDLKMEYNLAQASLGKIITVIAVNGYTFLKNEESLKQISDTVGGKHNFVTLENGFEKKNDFMDAFFTGFGIKFNKINSVTKPLEVIDVYQILKILLDLSENASLEQKILRYEVPVKEILIESIIPEIKVEEIKDSNVSTTTGNATEL